MSLSSRKPLVGVVSDIQRIEPHAFHTVGDKYLRALAQSADVIPVIIPAILPDQPIEQWLSHLDGVFLTGAYSMIDPALYNEARIDREYSYDVGRDALATSIVTTAIKLDLPLFAVCRGLQDINVALEGSLYQVVQNVADMMDHQEDKSAPLNEQYDIAHSVTLTEGGLLHNILGVLDIAVNSLHSQGINRLGNGLVVEATAPDGLIEAVRIEQMTFALAVQWHPEWKVNNNPQQKRLFEAFGDACRARQSK